MDEAGVSHGAKQRQREAAPQSAKAFCASRDGWEIRAAEGF
jgi:hypothetical protein